MRGGDVKTMTKRNSTDEQDVDDLRRSFAMALSDALKDTDKPTAALLEVTRKYLADQDTQRRWQIEQAALAGAGTAAAAPGAPASGSTETYPEDYMPPVPAGLDLSKLPFPSVKRRGVEQPPTSGATSGAKKTTETTDSDKPKDWTGLAQVPFLSPDH
jgi:hypothetical protein